MKSFQYHRPFFFFFKDNVKKIRIIIVFNNAKGLGYRQP